MLKTNHIYQGHALEVLKTWPDQSVHCVVTSPPYWNLRDYETTPIVWGGTSTCEHDWEAVIIGKARGSRGKDGWVRPSREANPGNVERVSSICTRCGAWSGALGLEPTIKMYIEHLKPIFQEVKRVLHNEGSLFVTIGDTFYGSGSGQKDTGKHSCYPQIAVSLRQKGTLGNELPKKSMCAIPERFVLMMMDELKWILRVKIVWWKSNSIPTSQTDRPTVDWEPVYFFTKRPRYWHELQLVPCTNSSIKQKTWGAVGGKKYAYLPKHSGKPATMRVMRTLRAVWNIPTVASKERHIAVFPPTLVEPIVKMGCPREVCMKCGKPRHPVYKSTESTAYQSKGKIAEADPDAVWIGRNLSGRAGESNRQIVEWTDCGCGVEFKHGIVADIFMGSGTTGMVAKSLNRRWVGIEMNPDYIRRAEERIGVDQTTIEEWMNEMREEDPIEMTLEEFM